MVQQDVVVSRVGTIHSLGMAGVGYKLRNTIGGGRDEYSGDPNTDYGKYIS